ncbi:stressosome-associated protein Prli42 [Paenibacillus rhizovicinus]|uniref:Stressosome-associated protein Prli42 n=1 Tax=Paenibacillus rhizovicinus TaxID=2704463 RepID=A0A6C0NWG9_9BACL|nr:stressosome-associated protein Prli42 [Paenibacillus rhizovicinus]QHW30256.1 stressosome-associated protein Prli42 [Paenibacillus rhizovicinus]
MRRNSLMKAFIWVLIAAMLLSTLLIGIGWMFE